MLSWEVPFLSELLPFVCVSMKGKGVQFQLHLWFALLFALTAPTCFSLGIGNQSMGCIAVERRALLDFKKGLHDPDNALSSWTSKEEDCCKWRGVGCDNTTSHVVMLELQRKVIYDEFGNSESYVAIMLTGEIRPSLLELKHLGHLGLSGNLFERIPEFIGSLTELTYLSLSFNPLGGIIPYQLGNLSRLSYLHLSSYDDGWTISDNLEWLSRLSSLKFLEIDGANFTKATNWFQVLQSHPSLSVLRLEGCAFAEVDPSSLSRFNSSNSLAVLHLMYSSGSHPSTFPLLLNISSNLVDLDLSYSNLSSSISDSFENMPALEHFSFRRNFMEGGIPKSLGNLCSLRELDLGYIKLNEPLAVTIENLSGCAKDSLEILALDSTGLNGSLPSFVSFSSLRELNLEDNQLSGHFRGNFGNFSELTVLNLADNQFTGPLPDLSRLSSLRELNLGYSQSSGHFRGGNQFTGPLPDLSRLSSLRELNLGYNRLSGHFRDNFGNFSKLAVLNLAGNQFTGPLPDLYFTCDSNQTLI